MRWHLISPFSFVVMNYVICVDGQPLVGVDGDAEEARISLKTNRYTRLKMDNHS